MVEMQGRKIVQGELQFIDIMSLLSMQYKNNLVMFAEVDRVKLPFLPFD